MWGFLRFILEDWSSLSTARCFFLEGEGRAESCTFPAGDFLIFKCPQEAILKKGTKKLPDLKRFLSGQLGKGHELYP